MIDSIFDSSTKTTLTVIVGAILMNIILFFITQFYIDYSEDRDFERKKKYQQELVIVDKSGARVNEKTEKLINLIQAELNSEIKRDRNNRELLNYLLSDYGLEITNDNQIQNIKG